MTSIKNWFSIIRMMLLDAEDKWLDDKAGNRAGMKYEKTPIKKKRKAKK